MVTLFLLLWGCQAEDPCVGGSMLDSPQGLVLTQAEHVEGWGQAECWACHAQPVLHRVGCTPDVDLDALQAIVQADGLDSCASCHGDNGSTP